jgi:hypothetical protein
MQTCRHAVGSGEFAEFLSRPEFGVDAAGCLSPPELMAD